MLRIQCKCVYRLTLVASFKIWPHLLMSTLQRGHVFISGSAPFPWNRQKKTKNKKALLYVFLPSGDIESGVEHLSNAVAVCSQPQQLLQVLQQTLPPQVFQLLLQRLPIVSQVNTLL